MSYPLPNSLQERMVKISIVFVRKQVTNQGGTLQRKSTERPSGRAVGQEF